MCGRTQFTRIKKQRHLAYSFLPTHHSVISAYLALSPLSRIMLLIRLVDHLSDIWNTLIFDVRAKIECGELRAMC